ncbi:hypothetical protein LINPERHAP2_LOCUS102 [Linum perenne]
MDDRAVFRCPIVVSDYSSYARRLYGKSEEVNRPPLQTRKFGIVDFMIFNLALVDSRRLSPLALGSSYDLGACLALVLLPSLWFGGMRLRPSAQSGQVDVADLISWFLLEFSEEDRGSESILVRSGRPVLTNVEQSDALSVQLQGAEIPHEVFVGTILSYDNLSIEM